MIYLGNLSECEQFPMFLRGVFLLHNRANNKVFLGESESIYYKLQTYRYVAEKRIGRTWIEQEIQELGERWFDVHLVEAFEDELSPVQRAEKVDYWARVFLAHRPERGYNGGVSQQWRITG